MLKRNVTQRYALAALIVLGISATPIQAQNWPQLNKENVGKGLGAITGAIIGSKVGGGSGRAAAIAVGTLAGYWAGGKVGQRLTQIDRRGINRATTRAVSTGQATAWRNPDTGTSTRVSVRDYTPRASSRLKPSLDRLPAIELVNAYYVPSTDINVRGGPGTDFEILHSIRQGKSVPVVGKVIDSNWYLIAEQGKASGFLYAPLMSLDHNQSAQSNAIREASYGAQPGRYAALNQNCRVITQKVSLRSGNSESHQFKACQQTNGNWVKI